MDNLFTELTASWKKHLGSEFEQPYMLALKTFLKTEKEQGKKILPKSSLWFNALNSVAFDKVKVVIVGQDPYPTVGHAHGLSFSVLPQVKLPKSLTNIYKELKDDLGVDNFHTGYLLSWAQQGVLLLNCVLTVEAGNANAHQGKGWEKFSDAILNAINDQNEHVVFILWGNYAQKKGGFINTEKHLVLKAPHPSPLSSYRGFFGSKPFSQSNDYLESMGKSRINWQIPKEAL
jgi:uracil-DNA glycosylase